MASGLDPIANGLAREPALRKVPGDELGLIFGHCREMRDKNPRDAFM